MQIGTVTNQYINNYHYQGVQQANQQSVTREVEDCQTHNSWNTDKNNIVNNRDG